MTNTLLWTSRQAAAWLNVSAARVQQLAKAGHIPAYRVAGMWRFDPNELRNWARQGRCA